MHRRIILLLLSLSLGLLLGTITLNLYAQNDPYVAKDKMEDEPISIVYDACTPSAGHKKSLDVHIFVDISDHARLAETNLGEESRKKILHLLVDFLFVDNYLRGEDVDNRFAIWLYSDETRLAQSSDFKFNLNSTTLVDENSLMILHGAIDDLDFDENASSQSNTIDFSDLVDTLAKEVANPLNGDENRIPVVILLNDMHPSGITYDDAEAATAVHDKLWQYDEGIPLAERVYFYVMDFSFTYYSAAPHEIKEPARLVRETWSNILFDDTTKPIQGGFHTITSENQLRKISRIIEELTANNNFGFLTAAPTKLDLCPFTKEVRFALIFDKPSIEHSVEEGVDYDKLMPGTELETERGYFSIVTSLIPSDSRVNLFPNNQRQDLDVLYAYAAIGGLPRSILSVCPSDTVRGGKELTIQWPITDTSDLRAGDLRIKYGEPPNRAEYHDEPAKLDALFGVQTLDNPLPDVDEDMDYELQIVNGDEEETCKFKLVPVPELEEIKLSELVVGQPFTATLQFSHADKIVQWEQLDATLQIFDENGVAKDIPSEFVGKDASDTGIYVVSSDFIVEMPLEWAFDVELVTKTTDGLDVNIKENQHFSTDVLVPSEPDIISTALWVISGIWLAGMVVTFPIYLMNQWRLRENKAKIDIEIPDITRLNIELDRETVTIPQMRYDNLGLQVAWILFTISSVLGGVWVFSQQYGSEASIFFWRAFVVVDVIISFGIVGIILFLQRRSFVEIFAFVAQLVAGFLSFADKLLFGGALWSISINADNADSIDKIPHVISVGILVILVVVWIVLLARTILEAQWYHLKGSLIAWRKTLHGFKIFVEKFVDKDIS